MSYSLSLWSELHGEQHGMFKVYSLFRAGRKRDQMYRRKNKGGSMKSLLFKTVEMCEEWEEKKRSDIQLITGLRDVINEMSDLLIKAETEKTELIEAIKLCEKALYEAHDRIDVMNMPPDMPSALQMCSYILGRG